MGLKDLKEILSISYILGLRDTEVNFTLLFVCKWALRSTAVNKASGCDKIPAELFKSLKEDAIKILHSFCQQILKTQQWSQAWKRSILIPIPKKGSTKECANHQTITLISHTSKVLLKILHGRLQRHANQELPDVQAGFSKEELEIKLPTFTGL